MAHVHLPNRQQQLARGWRQWCSCGMYRDVDVQPFASAGPWYRPKPKADRLDPACAACGGHVTDPSIAHQPGCINEPVIPPCSRCGGTREIYFDDSGQLARGYMRPCPACATSATVKP